MKFSFFLATFSISMLLLLPACASQAETAAEHYIDGLAFIEEGHYRQAIEEFDQVIELYPNDPAAFFIRGFSHSELGQHQLAIMD